MILIINNDLNPITPLYFIINLIVALLASRYFQLQSELAILPRCPGDNIVP